MKFNTNSNVYIIIYSVVMVVIVAVLLSLAALGLKPRQDENILNEKKTQIVKALGYDAATTAYGDVVAEALLLNADGAVVESDVAKVFEALQSVKDTRDAGQFPIFKATDGSVVVPLYGAGLWGPIWGYIGFEGDLKTIKAVCFGHKGETPGLGAKIADEPSFAEAFVGKTVGEGDVLFEIAKPANRQTENNGVDAISGATITSQALGKTLNQWFGFYQNYFAKNVEPANTVEE